MRGWQDNHRAIRRSTCYSRPGIIQGSERIRDADRPAARFHAHRRDYEKYKACPSRTTFRIEVAVYHGLFSMIGLFRLFTTVASAATLVQLGSR